MPRPSRIGTGVLESLAGELRFTSKAAAVRLIDRAAALALELDAARTYPEDWVAQRITGFSARRDDPAQLVGAALVGDLSALAERVALGAGLSKGDLKRPVLGVDALAARWGVSRRTVERSRRLGLVGVRVRDERAGSVLVFPLDAVERFERARRGAGLALPSPPSAARAGSALRARLLRRAERYAYRLGLSVDETARRLAARFALRPAAVRAMLLRADARRAHPLFPARAKLSAEARRFIAEAHLRGESPGATARALGRPVASVRRVLLERRAQALRRLDLHGPSAPWFADDARASEALAVPWVRTGLGGAGDADAHALAARASAQGPADAQAEGARARAYHLLRWRAARAIEALGRGVPGVHALDEIDTMLRWAAQLKAELVRAQAGLIVRSLEERLGAPMVLLPAAEAPRWVGAAIDAVAHAVDRHDPFRGGRLSGGASVALGRALAGLAGMEQAGLRRARGAPAALEDWTARLCAWQGTIGPPPVWRAHLGACGAEGAAVLARRWGWSSGPALTLRRAAAEAGVSERRVGGWERAVARAASGV